MRKRQKDPTHTENVLQVIEFGRADDGRGDALLGQAPGGRNLRHRHILLLCELFDPRYTV